MEYFLNNITVRISKPPAEPKNLSVMPEPTPARNCVGIRMPLTASAQSTLPTVMSNRVREKDCDRLAIRSETASF